MYILIRPFVLTDERNKGCGPYSFIDIFTGWEPSDNPDLMAQQVPKFVKLSYVTSDHQALSTERVSLTNFKGLIYFDIVHAQSEARRFEELLKTEFHETRCKLIVISIEDLRKLIIQEDEYWAKWKEHRDETASFLRTKGITQF